MPLKLRLFHELLSMDKNGSDSDKLRFMLDLEQAKPFIWDTKNPMPTIEIDRDLGYNPDSDPDFKMALPFRVCSIELSNWYLSTLFIDEYPAWSLCRLFIEHEPGKITVSDFNFILQNDGSIGFRSIEVTPSQVAWNVAQFNKLLSSSKIGLEKSVVQFPNLKRSNGTVKSFSPIKGIIHLAPRSQETPPLGRLIRKVEWTHQWFVMGHWRKFNGIGKDRAGERTVADYTWVSEHTKGNKEAPLINKIRVIH